MTYSRVETHAELRLSRWSIQSSPDPGGRELFGDEAFGHAPRHEEGSMKRTEDLVNGAEPPAHTEQLAV